MIDQYKKQYVEALLDTNRDLAFDVIDSAVNEDLPPETVIFDILLPGMEELAELVRVGPDTTLAQLYLASQISSEVTDRLIPSFSRVPDVEGKVVIGTAFEDFHGLGKKIVGGCLRAGMVEVVDLGLNVTADAFVEAAVKQDAQVIGISSMMVHTARGENGASGVRSLLRKEGLENRIKLVVGGAPYRFHPRMYQEVGADAWAENGIIAAKVITDLVREVRAS